MSPAEDLQETLERTVTALQSLVTGDPEPYLALWSRGDDVTVMGGFGGSLRGWDQVRENTKLAASRFGGGQISVEPLATGASGDLAYAVWIERGAVHLPGRAAPAPLVVRVTQLFRREDGAWKLIHRHDDQVTEKS
jgi:uncharacterized protein (TIGR02246 family)